MMHHKMILNSIFQRRIDNIISLIHAQAHYQSYTCTSTLSVLYMYKQYIFTYRTYYSFILSTPLSFIPLGSAYLIIYYI